jgi:2-polyprenyl-6-methoxyphenol hydroxylase-like FAD-dependent oxidoreductase
MNKTVLISGASIAGPVLAYWLQRYGFRPTIVERAPRLREGGNGVDVRGQALEVAERMGLLDAIRTAATDVEGMVFLDSRDRAIARMNLETIKRKNASQEVEVLRGELAAIVYQATVDRVEYRFGDSITSLEQTEQGVDVTFERGSPQRFDLVVGADGTHSTVRRLAFGPESKFIHFLNHYAAFAEVDPSLGEARWVTAYNKPGKMAGVYRSGNRPGAKANFIYRREEQVAYDYRDVAEQKRLVQEAFADATGRVRQMVDGAMTDPNFYFDALCQVRMSSWSSGRVALVGDAAYCASPISGGGAMLAMVGAYHLAGALHAAQGDHTVAFPRYEAGFRPSVEATQANLFTGLVVPRTSMGIWARNAFFRFPLMGLLSGVERRLQPKTTPLPDFTESRQAA